MKRAKKALTALTLGIAIYTIPIVILANDSPEIDEWLYCDSELKWGHSCGVVLKCFGSADGAVHITYPINGNFFDVDWAFEYVNPEKPDYTPTLCFGQTSIYPIETPRLNVNCKAKDGVTIRVNLGGCDFNWIEY
jgi:hypothetical protein